FYSLQFPICFHLPLFFFIISTKLFESKIKEQNKLHGKIVPYQREIRCYDLRLRLNSKWPVGFMLKQCEDYGEEVRSNCGILWKTYED
ncbi:hypothetical protein RYX36_008755, partial [Vicia faba]